MKKTNISKSTVALTVVILALFSGLALDPVGAVVIKFDEFQITTNPNVQEQPDIDGINIVWQDNRNGNWDIYMYTLEHTFTPETQITTNSANQIEPTICSDNIVYQDDRNGNWDIYMYSITTKTETQITTNTASQQFPDIDGDRIVWQDNRNGNWDIYFYNLTSKTEKRLTSASAIPQYTIMYSQNPSISGDIVAYQKGIEETWYNFQTYKYIYCYNLSSGQELDISRNSYKYKSIEELAIYGGSVVWQFIGVIYAKDLTSSNSWQVTSGPAWNLNPNIDRNYLVYANNRNNNSTFWNTDRSKNWDIYLTNLDTNIEYQVTNNTASQIQPAVSGGRVVYMDLRNGNWDIFMTMISYTPETIPPPSIQFASPFKGGLNEGKAPLQATPLQESPSETESHDTIPAEFEILFAALVIVVVIVPITLKVYHKKHRL